MAGIGRVMLIIGIVHETLRFGIVENGNVAIAAAFLLLVSTVPILLEGQVLPFTSLDECVRLQRVKLGESQC